MKVRDAIFAVLVIGAFLVYFLSLKTRIRTLFDYRGAEEMTDSTPSHPVLRFIGGVYIAAIGALVAKTGEWGWWGTGTPTQAYGPSVRAAGVVMIIMGISCSYPSIASWCRDLFRED